MTRFTDQQRRAIETRQTSVSLSAGAGCGKTFVLTERFLSHLEPGDADAPPADLHELIAITFTDRAAREMRDRIQKQCYERLQAATGEKADYWLRLLRSLDTARISTIHSFCGALLRAHAVEARLDPRFTVIEQTQADTLAAELIDDVLREKLSEQDQALIGLTVQFGLDRLRAMIASLLAGGRTIDFDTWLARGADEVTAIWDHHRAEAVVPHILQQVVDFPATRQLLRDICHLKDSTGILRERCQALSRIVPALPRSKNPAADLDDIFQNARIQGTGKREHWPDGSLYDRFKVSAEQVRKQAQWAKGFLEFDRAAAQADAVAGLELLKLVKAVLDRYEARKSELAWLDFNDLLVRARDLLVNPEYAELQRRLSSQVQLLLVDECQDTDPIQVGLIKALCGARFHAGQLFFVGDYKQSIYRFRGADPGIFRSLQQETPQTGRLPLSVNFRSQPAILDFVNAVFHDVPLGGDAATLTYEPLQPQRPQVSSTPAVEFLWAKANRKRHEGGATDEARKREAELIARRIRGMLDRHEPLAAQQDNGAWSTRTVRQGDIAILFQAMSKVQHYEEALRRHGIDYYLVGGHAFYAQQEIYDVVNLLRSLVSPADQIALAGALRSPIFALDDETLYWLGQHPQGLAAGLFADRLPAELTTPQHARAHFAADTLRHLRQRKDRMPIATLLNESLALTGYDATLLGEFLGERKLANLRKLIEQARTFDRSGVMGLADFIVQLAEFVAQQPREPLAATHPEGADVVRLMTIHQAKGLEFPVVFVPDVDRTKRGEDEPAVWHPQLGPLVKAPTRNDEDEHLTGLDLYRVMSATEAEAERLRLLYVATTRAADYLVLSGGVFDLQKPSAAWTKLLAEHFDLQTGRCLVEAAKGCAAPTIRVTTELPAGEHCLQSLPRCDLENETDRALAMNNGHKVDGDSDILVPALPVDAAARRRFSVSQLSGELRPAEDVPTVRLEDDEQPLGAFAAADLGTLVHRVLARIDYAGTADVAAIVRRLIETHLGETEGHQQSAVEMISHFLRSARAKSLSQARSVHRELEFLLPWPPADGGATASAAAGYLQGYIDCLYQDAGKEWHLLDYKTNRVSADQLAAAASQYEMQLGVYALAVEQILGKPPVELIVHFLQPAAEHRFVWNDAMRRHTIQQVNQAMAAMVNAEGRRRNAEGRNPRAPERAPTHS